MMSVGVMVQWPFTVEGPARDWWVCVYVVVVTVVKHEVEHSAAGKVVDVVEVWW